MKQGIVIVSLFVVGIFVSHAQEDCDTLKLKTVKTYYGEGVGSFYERIGELDGAVINTDSLSHLFPEMIVVNISNDTFSSDVMYECLLIFFLYADTGLLWVDSGGLIRLPIGKELYPNDTMNFGFSFLLSYLIDYFEGNGIDFEQISYWKIIAGITYTSKDGAYSERVFYEGADTSIFYVVRGGVGIQEKENHAIVSVFPNPAQTQFTVTNAENAAIQLFTMLGQEVLRTHSKEENTVVNIDFLPKGMYVLKVVKDGMYVRKIVVGD